MELFYWGTGVFAALLGGLLLIASFSHGLETEHLLILIGCVFWAFYAASHVL